AQHTAQRDQAETSAEAAATAIENFADGNAQAIFVQDQAAFDQAVAAAEAAYQAGPDDQASTQVPDFSQDPAVLAAIAAAEAAYSATTHQADNLLGQQAQALQATLQ